MSNQQLEPSSYQKNSAMSLSDIAVLVGFIGIYDLRIQVDELKVRAWAESFDSDLPLQDAKQIVSWHYANFDTAIQPSHINKEWRRRMSDAREREKSRLMSLEFEEREKQKASPEVIAKWKKEFQEYMDRNRVTDAPLETDSGTVAPDA
jgi:hypothetical protein